MWSDNETDRDFLNFKNVADITAEIIGRAEGRALSVGVSGNWGTGKSSMLRLLKGSLMERTDDRFIFVDFNAWLYQGFDDTRAALMEVIAQSIADHVAANTSTVGHLAEKANGLLRRVNWFRLAAVSATSVAGMFFGLPPVGLAAEAINVAKGLTDGQVSQQDVNAAGSTIGAAVAGAKGLLNDKIEPQSPPKAIHAFRDELKNTLGELGITLVVLIDDLDRCLPTTTISTLEAMRLFLLVENTAFVIAADDRMIREAVRTHFQGVDLDDDLVTSYFDKLIQVPVRVPPLGTQDVRAYLMLLYIENSDLEAEVKDKVREAVSKQLGQTWQGKRVDVAFVRGLLGSAPNELLLQLELADRLAPMMVRASKIAGNPRLIKRFLNTISIRMSIAADQGISIDEAALAKVLLFERSGDEKAYRELLNTVNDDVEGRARFLASWEESARKNPDELTLEPPWNLAFVKEWLALDPPLADIDLRGIAYVSRELLPIVTSSDRLSSEGAELLEALMTVRTDASKPLTTKLAGLSKSDLDLITERVVAKSKSAIQWGTPDALWQLITLAGAEGQHVEKIGRFLKGLPGTQVTAAIVPVLADKEWAQDVLRSWAKDNAVDTTVKRAIAAASKKKEG